MRELSVLTRAIFPVVVVVVFSDRRMRTASLCHHSLGPSKERPRETEVTETLA